MYNLNTLQEDALSGNIKSSYPGWQVNTKAEIVSGTDDEQGKPGFWKQFMNTAKQLLTTGTLNMPTAKSYPAPPPYNDATQNLPSGRHVNKMEHIERFHKGNEWGSGASNEVFYDGHEDPTFLTFKVEFGEWGASITDNNSIASVQRMSINNNTWLMDYDQMPMGLLDLNYIENGSFNDLETYNAYNFLMNRNEDRRALYVRDFVDGLYSIQRDFPYMFQRINGVDKLTTVDTHLGQRLKDCVLKLSCINDTIDWKIRTLMELYRKAAWDDVYQRWSLPDVLRFFKMIIYVFDSRTIAMPGGQFSPDNEMLPILAFECSPCEFVISDGLDQPELTVDYKNLKMTEPTLNIRVHNVRTFYCNRMFKRVKYINDMYAATIHDNSIIYTDENGNVTGAQTLDDGDAMMQDGRTIAWQYVWLQRMFLQPDEWALGAHWNAANESTAQSHYFADERDEEMLNSVAAASQIDLMPDNTWHYATVTDHGYIIKNFSDLWGAVKDIVTSRTQLIRDSRQSNRYYFVNDLFYIDQWSELARQQLLDIDVEGARADVIRKIKQMIRHLKEYAILNTSSGYNIQDVSITGEALREFAPEPPIEQTDAPKPEPGPEIKGELYKYDLVDVSINGAENPDFNPQPAIVIRPYKYNLSDVSIDGADNPDTVPNPPIIQDNHKYQLTDVSINGAKNPSWNPRLEINGGKSPKWNLTLDLSGGISKNIQMTDIPYTPAPKLTPDVFIIQNLDKYAEALTELDMNLRRPDMDLISIELNLKKIIQEMTELDMNLNRDDMDLIPLDMNLDKYHGPLQELILNLDKYAEQMAELDLNLVKPKQELTNLQMDLHKDIQQLAELILDLSHRLMDMNGLIDDTSLPELQMTPVPLDASIPEMTMSKLIMNIHRLKQNLIALLTTTHKPEMDMVTVDIDERKPDMQMNGLVQNLQKPHAALSPADIDNHKAGNAMPPLDMDVHKYVQDMTPTDMRSNLPDEEMTPQDMTVHLPEQEMNGLEIDVHKYELNSVGLEGDTHLPEQTMTVQDMDTHLSEQKMNGLLDDTALPKQTMTEYDKESELPEQKMTELAPEDGSPEMLLASLDKETALPELKMNGIEAEPYEPGVPTVHIDQETELPEMKMSEVSGDKEKPDMLMNGLEEPDARPDMKMSELLRTDNTFTLKPVSLDDNSETPDMKMTELSESGERPEILMNGLEDSGEKPAASPMEDLQMNTDHDYRIHDSEVKEDEAAEAERRESMRAGIKDVKVIDNSDYAKDLLADRIRMLQSLDTDTLEKASFEQLNKLVGILQDTVSQVNKNIKMQELEVRQEKTGKTMKMQHIISDDEESHFGGGGHMKEMLTVSQDAMDRADAAYARAHEKKK